MAETNNTTGMEENKVASKIRGSIAKNTKTVLENKTGKKVSLTENYLPPKLTK
ncbi:MAG: phage antirepressor protein [Rickettsia endosymbiont of Glossina mortisans submortisans]|nr:phage antirepressor protein [Rickettsia endosymbiont of Glossina mortisans submortisans]